MNPVIELNNLSVTFGRRPILKGLSGTVKGRAVGLLGPNGAGKTTLIHTLLGFHAPSSGTVRMLRISLDPRYTPSESTTPRGSPSPSASSPCPAT